MIKICYLAHIIKVQRFYFEAEALISLKVIITLCFLSTIPLVSLKAKLAVH